jgi:hypothetical protein
VFSFSALADDDHNNNNNNYYNNNNSNISNNGSSFQAGVIGSTTGQSIGGVSSGGAPWVVRQGAASISPDGRIQVEVQGLLIAAGGPANLVGTTGPVGMVAATLVCGGTGGSPVPVSDFVTPTPLSSLGNAEIFQTVTLPASCLGPVVLIRIFNTTSQLGAFIAATGLTPNGAQNQNPNQNGHEGNDDNGHGH